MSLNFKVAEIPPEGLQVEGKLAIDELDIDYRDIALSGPVSYSLDIRVIDREFLAVGALRAEVKLNCSRCLKPITEKISIRNYRYNGYIAETELIDLTPSLREDIIFALPLKPLCKRDCKGICPRCGKDLNTGPCSCESQGGDWRWSAFENFKIPRGGKS
jgi:uncharacterized protein